MAFNAAHMTCMAQGNGSKIWMYRTADAVTVVDTAGYFNDFAAMLSLGDVIINQTVDDPAAVTSVSAVGMHYVNANDGSTVDVTNVLALTATDTD